MNTSGSAKNAIQYLIEKRLFAMPSRNVGNRGLSFLAVLAFALVAANLATTTKANAGIIYDLAFESSNTNLSDFSMTADDANSDMVITVGEITFFSGATFSTLTDPFITVTVFQYDLSTSLFSGDIHMVNSTGGGLSLGGPGTYISVTVTQRGVPAPAALGFIGFGLMSMGIMRRRRKTL